MHDVSNIWFRQKCSMITWARGREKEMHLHALWEFVCLSEKENITSVAKATKSMKCETTNFHLLSFAENHLHDIKAGLAFHNVLDAIMCPAPHIYYPLLQQKNLSRDSKIPHSNLLWVQHQGQLFRCCCCSLRTFSFLKICGGQIGSCINLRVQTI